MLHIGLTGNIAAGKSSVVELFRRFGATVIDADTIVRELQRPGEPVYEAIVAEFGAEVLAADQTIDRPVLRARVLADPAALAELNALVHPAVHARRAQLLADARARGDAVVVSDIPLLFETADPSTFDAIVLVDAPVEVRRDRLLRDRGLAREEADRAIAAQMPAEQKRPQSTLVIDNAGDRRALEIAARAAWERLTGSAPKPGPESGPEPGLRRA